MAPAASIGLSALCLYFGGLRLQLDRDFVQLCRYNRFALGRYLPELLGLRTEICGFATPGHGELYFAKAVPCRPIDRLLIAWDNCLTGAADVVAFTRARVIWAQGTAPSPGRLFYKPLRQAEIIREVEAVLGVAA